MAQSLGYSRRIASRIESTKHTFVRRATSNLFGGVASAGMSDIPDASEADVQEQREDVRGVGRAGPTRSAEVPEADAYEQSLEVDDDEDELD